MRVLLLLLACPTQRPPWTHDGALAPHLARIDADHDGRVTDAEWARVAYAAPPLGSLDEDGDGALSAAELARWLATQDPVRFDAPHATAHADADSASLLGVHARHAWEELTTLCEAAAARGRAVPTPAEVEAAVAENAPDGPALRHARAVLASDAPDPLARLRQPCDARVRDALDAAVRTRLGWETPSPALEAALPRLDATR
ncbi:MAG: hypothetical protein RLZZ299_1859 [Pseudomonadota bacterium]